MIDKHIFLFQIFRETKNKWSLF